MTALRETGSTLMLWCAATIGCCRRARGWLGWRHLRDEFSGDRIGVREGRAFRRDLRYTDDLVGRLQTEPRQLR